ncbi:DUF3515 domain-containing protein [Streptomyces sp. NPDC050504]|uniref:DUF3515 domain-containing protein n=1 Tax=Streptomyces sp. NPDC050504 TaxID=3365618 RepID=UPI003794D7FB
MPSFRHRLLGPSAALLLLFAAGCSSTDAAATITVPTPSKKTAALCDSLDRELPKDVAGGERRDPEPESTLTAAWGDSAIVLRCGVPRPAKMTDPGEDGMSVDGVAWLVEELEDGGYRFTTGLRLAYVEVTLDAEHAREHGAGLLTEFAAPVKKTVPEGVAD